MKSHRTLDECFDQMLKRGGWTFMLVQGVKLEEIKEIFNSGWYACANEINQGEDSDWLQERLYEEGFLKKEE